MKKVHLFFALSLAVVSSFLTACTDPDLPGTVKDKDGNVYQTVTIGTQTWMVENLKTTKYNDGTNIPNVTDDATWGNLTTPAYCWYNNDASTYKNVYGALYNWEAVNSGKLAPTGWRIPTDDDWTTLVNYVTANLGTSTSLAKALSAKINWESDTNVGAIGNDLSNNNSSGFTALPGGYRNNMNGLFFSIGVTGGWWSATEFNSGSGNYKCMWNNLNSLYENIDHKTVGYSVRCIKN